MATQTQTIELIGAGLPRTGTLTQKVALEELGLGPCYHWVDLLADLDQLERWSQALDGDADWGAIFKGARSTVDWPGGYFYRELLDAYPDAKVLLSVRDPESWERSFRETIVTMSHGDSVMPLLARARAEIDPRWRAYLAFVDRMFWGPQGTFAEGWAEPEMLIEQMNKHTEQVKQAVPPERLLVWEVGEGWGPLCGFLGVPEPSGPLPHANDRATFLDRVMGGALETLQRWYADDSRR
jgi:hypothetical protein